MIHGSIDASRSDLDLVRILSLLCYQENYGFIDLTLRVCFQHLCHAVVLNIAAETVIRRPDSAINRNNKAYISTPYGYYGIGLSDIEFIAMECRP